MEGRNPRSLAPIISTMTRHISTTHIKFFHITSKSTQSEYLVQLVLTIQKWRSFLNTTKLQPLEGLDVLYDEAKFLYVKDNICIWSVKGVGKFLSTLELESPWPIIYKICNWSTSQSFIMLQYSSFLVNLLIINWSTYYDLRLKPKDKIQELRSKRKCG